MTIKTALSVADQIKSGKGSGDTHVGERAFLGVSIQNGPAAGRETAAPHARARSWQRAVRFPGGRRRSPAGRRDHLAGGEERSSSIDDLTSALAPHHPGDKVEVGWTDNSGDRHTAQVTLASGPPA